MALVNSSKPKAESSKGDDAQLSALPEEKQVEAKVIATRPKPAFLGATFAERKALAAASRK
jgi:hypothetical protein